MKAYINTKPVKSGWYAEVVTEQDHNEGGPWAHSYRSDVVKSPTDAGIAALNWAMANKLEIVEPEEI